MRVGGERQDKRSVQNAHAQRKGKSTHRCRVISAGGRFGGHVRMSMLPSLMLGGDAPACARMGGDADGCTPLARLTSREPLSAAAAAFWDIWG